MKNMTIGNILKACGGTYTGPEGLLEKEVSSVVIDSRKVGEGSLFIAMRGERADGHRFIPSSYESGALCALGEDDVQPEEGRGYIRVASSGTALKDIAGFYRSSLDVKVVGITGSVGKTSTKETIAAFLAKKFCVHKTAGNFNNEIGLPLTILDLKPEHEVAVLEMGINHFGEMTRLAKVAKPDISVITNIGNCHLEFLNDRDGVLAAKTEMFAYLAEDGTAILKGDDDKLITVSEVKGKKPLFFGLEDHNDYRALRVKNHGLAGSDCALSLRGRELAVHIPVPGEHVIYNVLAACAVADQLGISLEMMQEAAGELKAVEGRGQILQTENYTIFNDCYNANPASMCAALDVLAYADGRKVAIMGDMLELGDRESELHRETGAHAASIKPDLILTAGRLGADIAIGAKNADPGLSVFHYEDKEALLEALPKHLRKGDTVLVKASHAMGFENIVEELSK